MRVLFCTDGSEISYNSIINLSKWAKEITVDILCVADWSYLPDSIVIEDGEFTLKCTNTIKSILNATENYLRENNISIRKSISICGSTVDSILETETADNYDAVVLGSNGKSGLKKWLGSVSHEVVSNSKISNYISKRNNKAQKVLFAVDNSDISNKVVDKAMELLDLSNKEIFLVTVYESPDYLFLEGNIDSNWINDTNKKQEISAYKFLNKLEEKFYLNNISIKDKFVLSGNPASEIIKLASVTDIDLVVCGMRNRNYITKFLLSSVSKRILENTKSDVFIIRPNNH